MTFRPIGNNCGMNAEAERHHAEEWRRQIINAGGDENVAQQAVALAALNGLFDINRSLPDLPAATATTTEREDEVEKLIAALNTLPGISGRDFVAIAFAIRCAYGMGYEDGRAAFVPRAA